MKRYFLILALLFGTSLQGYCWNCWNPPLTCYINFFGAPNWLQVDGLDCKISTKLGFMAGTGLGLQLGCYHWILSHSRLEVEYSIRKNQLNEASNDILTVPLTGSASTNCWMVDYYQDFPFCGYFIPYVGVGTGYSYRNTMKQVELFSGEKDVSNGFAWQVVAGLSTFVNVATVLSVEYRYFNSPEDLHQQTVGLALRYLY